MYPRKRNSVGKHTTLFLPHIFTQQSHLEKFAYVPQEKGTRCVSHSNNDEFLKWILHTVIKWDSRGQFKNELELHVSLSINVKNIMLKRKGNLVKRCFQNEIIIMQTVLYIVCGYICTSSIKTLMRMTRNQILVSDSFQGRKGKMGWESIQRVFNLPTVCSNFLLLCAYCI